MRPTHAAYSLILLCLLLSNCVKEEVIMVDSPFTQITLDSVSLRFIVEKNRQGESWDDNGGRPDVFLRAAVHGNQSRIQVLTDTLVDFQPGDVFTMRRSLVLTRGDTLVHLIFKDDDFIPHLPRELQADDQLTGVTLDPWHGVIHNFVESDELHIRTFSLDATFYVTRE